MFPNLAPLSSSGSPAPHAAPTAPSRAAFPSEYCGFASDSGLRWLPVSGDMIKDRCRSFHSDGEERRNNGQIRRVPTVALADATFSSPCHVTTPRKALEKMVNDESKTR
uniref:Uncharacterized protein n=1 Tax=Knipowitschia caucasica TaxID=637954 RepID=A0AAV2J5F2_KNICA